MKISNVIKILQFILLLLIFNNLLFAQAVVEKSKDKVTISGIPYYVHIVRKGETAYSISKAYGVTVEELTKENPPALYGVKEGQSLRIAVKQSPAAAVAENTPVKQVRDETDRFLKRFVLRIAVANGLKSEFQSVGFPIGVGLGIHV